MCRRTSRVYCQIIHPSTQDCLYTVPVSPSYSPIGANACSACGSRIEQWLCGDAAMGVVFFDCCSQSTRDTSSSSQGLFISTSLSHSHNTAMLVVHPQGTDILHSPAHPVPSIVPFGRRVLTCLFATRSCGWPNRSEATGHTDSADAADNGRRSVRCIQRNDNILRHSDRGSSNAMILGTKPDIWRVDCIGEGAFRNAVRAERANVCYIVLMLLHEGDRG